MASGVDLAIVSGHLPSPLARVDAGEGTRFVADRRSASRKAWLSGRLTVTGAITIDGGAMTALRGGASLLPAGATGVTGDFRRGDVVDIIDRSSAIASSVVARGLSEYDADDARRILGLRSDAIAAVLGHAPRAALIHRDHLVML